MLEYHNPQSTFQVIITAAIKNVNSIGPSMSPCLTPIIHSSVCVTSSTVNLTLKLAYKAFNRLISFGGTPNLASIFQRSSLGTRSKALTKSRKKIQDYFPCSHLFLRAILIVKIASVDHFPGRRIEVHDLNFPGLGGV